jgi:4-hydroxybenzoate polyprenyltransferase
MLIPSLAQILGFEEDEISKPHRPFPWGRISLKQGEHLYLLAIALCIAASLYYRLLPVSLVFLSAIWLNNEAGWAMNPIAKSPLSAIGYMCFCWGTTFILGKVGSTSLTQRETLIFPTL